MKNTALTPIEKMVCRGAKKIVPGKPFFLDNHDLTQLEQFSVALDDLTTRLEVPGGDFFSWYDTSLFDAGYPLIRETFLKIEDSLSSIEDLRIVYKSRETIEEAHRLLSWWETLEGSGRFDEDRHGSELDQKLENLKKDFLKTKPELLKILNHWVERQMV